jgi:glycosyltransferase involved in cell wall biosynthesis
MKIWFAEFESMPDIDLYDLTEPEDPEDCVELWWGDPAYWRWSRYDVKARVSLALSEAHSLLASGRLEALENLAQSDMIICPSQSATLAFREAPLDLPIRVVPFGVDTEEFKSMKSSFNSLYDRSWNAALKFIHSGVTQFRKGSWLVPEAFIKAFSNDDIAELTIHSYRSSPMFTKLNSEYGNHPKIDFVENRDESLWDRLWKHHIYVSPHLSEGFGLINFEAMATGMPVIMSRCSAPREFFSKDYGWWIEMSEDYAPVSQCLPDTSGYWRLPSIDSLAGAMVAAYEDRKECQQKGNAASKYIRENLTWKHTASGIVECIQEVLDGKAVSDNVRLQRRETYTAGSGEYQRSR